MAPFTQVILSCDRWLKIRYSVEQRTLRRTARLSVCLCVSSVRAVRTPTGPAYRFQDVYVSL